MPMVIREGKACGFMMRSGLHTAQMLSSGVRLYTTALMSQCHTSERAPVIGSPLFGCWYIRAEKAAWSYALSVLGNVLCMQPKEAGGLVSGSLAKSILVLTGLNLTGQSEHELHMQDATGRERITSSQCLPQQAY